MRRRWPIKPARISLPSLPLAEVVVIALCYDSEGGGGGGRPTNPEISRAALINLAAIDIPGRDV